MNNNLKRLTFSFGFFCLLLTNANANFCDLKTHIYYGNGMFNAQNDASLAEYSILQKLRSTEGFDEDEWDFDISYNHDEKLLSIFEVFRQREGERASKFWKWISGLSFAPDWFQELALNLASQQSFAEAVIDSDLNRHIDTYRNLLMEGHRILVIAHSQGNLYANAAYENLLRDDNHLPMASFRILSIATPSSYVAGGGRYFTLTNDLVIDSVRLFYWDTLGGNVTNSSGDNDWKHHSFISAYLNGDQSGPLIIDTAIREAGSLPWPTPKIGNGPISVTLNWGDQPDLDLHVYEPDGTHVYYDNPEGPTGFLDYDDRTSYGPEHYYVLSCDDLTTGTYTIGVNYYKGDAPETARIQIKAGDITRDYTKYLAEAERDRGDSNPEIVAKIQITEDENEAQIFSVWGN